MDPVAVVGYAALAAAVLLFLVLARAGVRYFFRGTPVRGVRALDAELPLPAVGDPTFEATLGALVGVTPAPGHRVEVLANGDETFPRLLADLHAARRSITFAMYYWQPGRTCAPW